MSKPYDTIGSAELSSRLRGWQNSGHKIVVIEMNLGDLESGKFGNVNPSSLADAIFRREGNEFAVVRNRLPREPLTGKKRVRLSD